MNRPAPLSSLLARRAARTPLLTVLLLGSTAGVLAAPPLAPGLATFPLFLTPSINPNVLVLFDNSGSMDATMEGKVVSGSEPDTRSNIARTVLRNVITTNRSAFDWGLGTFDLLGAPLLYNTTAYFFGSATTMVYTDNCSLPTDALPDATGYSVDGPQVVNSKPGDPVTYKANCLRNPDVDFAGAPRNGMRYLTFERSGDDADINDVFYNSSPEPYAFGFGILGVSGKPNRYNIYRKREATKTWASSDFKGADCTVYCPVDFTPTDAGWLPEAAVYGRMLFIKRGWGYGNGIRGGGRIVERVVSADATGEPAHFATLMAALAPETNTATGEIKNAAFSTPLAGTVKTARDYFAGNLAGDLKSPVLQTCQRNYVVLATDGNPTGKLDGTQYAPSQWLNTKDADGKWIFGSAQQDVFDQITGLRTTQLSGANLSAPALRDVRFDIQTYVVGLGESVANASSVAALNQMAVLGGGYPQAFFGTSTTAVEQAFQTIVGNIRDKKGGASSVSVNAAILSSSTEVYQATFDSGGWRGDLRAFSVTGSGVLQPLPKWSAAAKLDAQNWDTGRTLLTYKASASIGARGIAFRWPANPAAPTPLELDPAQMAALNTSVTGSVDGYGSLRLRYLRGDRTREAANCAGCTPALRNRESVLGDMVNSAPTLVGAPVASYYDDIESAAYSVFAAEKRARSKVLYVGANDGMLHAFDAATGSELMGYVPSALFGSLSALTSTPYAHRYFADGTPTVGDAFYGGSWKTLLVAGMRAGARGLYALDVTNPGAFSESGAANVVRWEFQNAQDADMGHVFSQPVIAKTNNGKWSVIVANGYAAGSASSGRAVLFVLDAETGAVVKKLSTSAGSLTSPNGLSGPAAIDTNDDGVIDIVYAGDLNGNLWKFDLAAASPGSWAVGNGGEPLFRTDPDNREAGTRAITSRPNVTPFPQGGLMVVFGTGRYIATSDLTDTAQQALYGIWDNLTAGTVPVSALVQQTVVSTANGADGVLYRLTTHAVGDSTDAPATGDGALSLATYYGSKRGWYLNLPTGRERSVTDTRIRSGRALFTTLIPSTADPCDYGGKGWIMELDVITGNRDDGGTFDTNNSGAVDANDLIPFSGAGRSVGSGRYVEGGIPAMPRTIQKPDDPDVREKPPCAEVNYGARSDGSTERYVTRCDRPNRGRAMWREVR